MKKYNITVNGKTYEVEVEEIGKSEQTPVQIAPVTRPSAPAPKPSAPKAPQAKPSAGSSDITAPMPGTVLEIKVTQGQTVKSGELVMILEAMKMENEIFAPADGTIEKIHINQGASVNSGDLLISIK